VKDLTKLARGEECDIRVPGICTGNPQTVVCCHLRMSGISGYGIKAPDVLAAHGCQACHDYVDGRTQGTHTHEERRSMLLEGMARTQYKLIKRGILRW
jgi:hypothetical protein